MKCYLVRLFAALLVLLAVCSCAVSTQYIGKSYPATTAPELYFDWADVPRPYVTIGYAEAVWIMKADKAQAAIERKACEKGADAIVFGPMQRIVTDQTLSTTITEGTNVEGNRTQTISTSQTDNQTNKLQATFIKYR